MLRALLARLLVLTPGACLLAETPHPVKLQVDAPRRAISLGERTTLTIRLLDASNRPALAPKDLTVEILARLPSNTIENLTSATVKTGESAVQVMLPPAKNEGFLYIWARQPELLLGGAYLRVKSTQEQRKSQPAPPTVLRPAPIVIPKVAARVPGAIPAPPPPPIAAPAPSAEPAPSASGRYQLALRYSPQRSFLANGKDPVTVHAFVIPRGDTALPGFRVNLYDGSGTLNPIPLVIPAGAEAGSATLTYDHVGDVKVEYLSAAPPMDIDSDKALIIHFDPPITGLDITGSPSRITLVDESDLVLTLAGDAGRPIETRETRAVSLALDSGRGQLSKEEIVIEAGKSEARVAFTPLWWGKAVISARTPNLLRTAATIQVDPPLGLLAISIIGGLLGGLVFVLRHPRSKRWRVPVGALTGVLLFWAFLFLGLSALPRTAILNPISIFAVSMIGGWLGTEVFEPLLKRLNLAGGK